MDPTLYEEITRGVANRARLAVEMKSSLSLDFANVALKKERSDGVLGSCDLELPSPDLERFLLQHEGADGGASGALSTPTTQILFPKSVTEEQEAYARGFIDALEQLHRSQGTPAGVYSVELGNSEVTASSVGVAPASSMQPLPSVVSYSGAAGVPTAQLRESHPYTATVHHVPVGHVPFHSSAGATSAVPVQAPLLHQMSVPMHASPNMAQFHTLPVLAPSEAPQTVPRLGDTPPLSPINMDDQERIKLERKRARNRMAARKCRTRKLEQIAMLEQRVTELKSQNAGLASSALTLKDEVSILQAQLREHIASGSCYANTVMHG